MQRVLRKYADTFARSPMPSFVSLKLHMGFNASQRQWLVRGWYVAGTFFQPKTGFPQFQHPLRLTTKNNDIGDIETMDVEHLPVPPEVLAALGKSSLLLHQSHNQRECALQ